MKINLVSIAAIASIGVITALNCAEHRTPWESEAREAYYVGMKKGLGPHEIELVQEQLRLLATIPIKFINNENYPIELVLRDIQTGVRISTKQICVYPNDWIHPVELMHEEKMINVPTYPVKINVTLNRWDISDGRIIEVKSKLGSFSLSMEELSHIESIEINHMFAAMRYKNGAERFKLYSVPGCIFS